MRMDEERQVNKIWETRKGRRNHRRSRTTWNDSIAVALWVKRDWIAVALWVKRDWLESGQGMATNVSLKLYENCYK